MTTTAERAALLDKLAAIEVFTRARPGIPAQYIRTFIYVALNEGRTVRELAQMTSVAPTVMARHLLDLGGGVRNLEPGMHLVETKLEVDPDNRRAHRAFLTETGKATLKLLASKGA
jgi:hypothetical protein